MKSAGEGRTLWAERFGEKDEFWDEHEKQCIFWDGCIKNPRNTTDKKTLNIYIIDALALLLLHTAFPLPSRCRQS